MDRVLCQCMNITEREVKQAIRAGARTVDAVGEACEAGSGCGSCRGGIEVLILEDTRRRSRRSLPQAIVDQLRLFGGSDS